MSKADTEDREHVFYGIPSIPSRDVKPGIYRHYKGGLYRVLGMIRDSTNATAGRWLVQYVSLTYGEVHARHVDEWLEDVEWPDGEVRSRYIFASMPAMAPSKR